MSNTGSDKVLATFNCDRDLWQRFKDRCRESGSNATAVLIELMTLYLETDLGRNLEEGRLPVSQREIEGHISSYLDQNLYIYIDKYLDLVLEQRLQAYLERRDKPV